ncbi:MAG TPA: ABC transporter substrate-binding protein [Chloroflexota bacterium]|nr:ABC transporter substrate-binding protein [Chloroflexota bacterium]
MLSVERSIPSSGGMSAAAKKGFAPADSSLDTQSDTFGSGISRRRLLKVSGLAGLGLALAGCGGTAPAASAPAGAKASASALPKLTVAYASVNGAQWPEWMAVATNAWQAHGLDVDLRYLEGDVGTKSLVAKQVDVLLQSAQGMLTANLNGGLDLVYVGSLYNHQQFALMVAPSIKTAADLKGKGFASDKPGTAVDFAARQLLKQLGLTLSDVTVYQVGVSQALVTALLSGQTVAAPLAPPNSFTVEAKGFHAITDLYKLPTQAGGAIVSKARVDELSSRLAPFLLGLRDGIRAFNSQKELAIKVLQEQTKQTDADILQRTYDFYKTSTPFQEDLKPSLEGLQALLDFNAETVLPQARNANPEQFVDMRILEKLPKS